MYYRLHVYLHVTSVNIFFYSFSSLWLRKFYKLFFDGSNGISLRVITIFFFGTWNFSIEWTSIFSLRVYVSSICHKVCVWSQEYDERKIRKCHARTWKIVFFSSFVFICIVCHAIKFVFLVVLPHWPCSTIENVQRLCWNSTTNNILLKIHVFLLLSWRRKKRKKILYFGVLNSINVTRCLPHSHTHRLFSFSFPFLFFSLDRIVSFEKNVFVSIDSFPLSWGSWASFPFSN